MRYLKINNSLYLIQIAINAVKAVIGKDSEDKELDEFSGVGAIAGFSLPLGMSPDLPVPGSKSRKKSKKRKNPSWA